MILAEFNPTILFLLLWGILSWITKKKKNQLKEKDQGEYSDMEPKADLFARIQKLQDHFSTESKIFPLATEPTGTEEEYFTEDDENSFEESKIIVPDPEEERRDEGYVFDRDIKIPITRQDHWIKKNLSQKSDLRKLMVLKEVMGEPRSLKPYTGNYFQS
ncbi:uncharacterized protein METZ01_LOCUS171226 [marine metagenome]|uniref:Uncharacterized protein n=1 Tax=marine metagenome TaxID=408172 RepID=A0A382BXX5_9ZZZZ